MASHRYIILIFSILFIIVGCKVEENNADYLYHSVIVYGIRDMGAGEWDRSEEPIFDESHIALVEYDCDISRFRVYFTDEYLSDFTPESVIEKHELNPLETPLRIYSEPYYKMFEVIIDDKFMFRGYFPTAKLSSFVVNGPIMIHELDGMTLTIKVTNKDFLGIDTTDEVVLLNTFDDLELLR